MKPMQPTAMSGRRPTLSLSQPKKGTRTTMTLKPITVTAKLWVRL